MSVIYTALFSDYENLKEPTVITPGWDYKCFTDQTLQSTAWEIIKVDPVTEPVRLARYYKIMEWVDWPRSIWVDASFVIDTDLDQWWAKYFKGGLSVPSHPMRTDIYEECMACILGKRGDRVQVDAQMNEYRSAGVPGNTGIIQSGLMMRENTPEVIELCEAWWREMVPRSSRDQIAFARICSNFKCWNTYRWDYREEKDFIYKHHYYRR